MTSFEGPNCTLWSEMVDLRKMNSCPFFLAEIWLHVATLRDWEPSGSHRMTRYTASSLCDILQRDAGHMAIFSGDREALHSEGHAYHSTAAPPRPIPPALDVFIKWAGRSCLSHESLHLKAHCGLPHPGTGLSRPHLTGVEPP